MKTSNNKSSNEPKKNEKQNKEKPNCVEYLSSCFVNSICKGVSLKEFVNQIDSSKGKPNSKGTNHSVSQKTIKTLNSSMNKEDNTLLSSYQKNVKTRYKKPPGAKSISFLNEEDTESLIETFKVSNESEKQRRLYEEKVKAMKNRLNAIKKQEDDLSRKINAIRNKERELGQIKEEKDMFKNALKSFKYDNNEKLQLQKQKNNEQKIYVKTVVKESGDQMKIKKHAEFDLARTEKQLVNTMISENTEHIDNINQRKIDKIKTDYERFKAEEYRRKKEHQENMKRYYLSKMARDENETQTLKNQIAEMEKLEDQYVQSLRTTQKENEKLFKGSWILKTEDSNIQSKINVKLKPKPKEGMKRVVSSRSYVGYQSELNTDSNKKKGESTPKNFKYSKPLRNSHHREKSVEVSNSSYLSQQDKLANKPKKYVTRSIERTPKAK